MDNDYFASIHVRIFKQMSQLIHHIRLSSILNKRCNISMDTLK